MTILLLVAAAVLAGLAGLWIYNLTKTLKEFQTQQQANPGFQLLQQQINHVNEEVSKNLRFIIEAQQKVKDNVNEKLDKAAQTMGERLDNAARVVGMVQKSLGSLDQKAEQIFTVGKDISSLQEILRAPKLRGVLGELSLGDLLAQILPSKHYSLQYTFKTGEMVDAVVRLGERGQKLVPIDSKFPLENFRKMTQAQSDEEKKPWRKKFTDDVKKHIKAIATKYILPDEGTFDFALMFIMAENVYYETIIKDENLGEEKSLMAYAFENRVIPVSPNSFYAYLHTIILGLRGLQVEENAKMILEHISRLRGDFVKFEQDFEILGKHLGHTRGAYDEAEKRLDRFNDKLEGVLEAAPENPEKGPPQKISSDANDLPNLLTQTKKGT